MDGGRRTQADTRQSLASALVAGAVVLVVGWASGLGTLVTGATAAPAHDMPAPPDAAASVPSTASAIAGPASTGTAVGSWSGEAVTTPSAPASGAPAHPGGPTGSGSAGGTPTAPSSPSAPAGPTSPSVPVGTSAACTSLVDAVLQPFSAHLDSGHLQESPAQQIADLLDVSRYIATHTALVEAMVQPLYAVLPAVARSVDAFVQHVYHGHLEESPSQQVGDILDPDQYVKTHTVLVESMAAPLQQTVSGC